MRRLAAIAAAFFVAGLALFLSVDTMRAQTTDPAPSAFCTLLPPGYSLVPWDFPTTITHSFLSELEIVGNRISMTLDHAAGGGQFGWVHTAAVTDQVGVVIEMWGYVQPQNVNAMAFAFNDPNPPDDFTVPIDINASSFYSTAVLVNPPLDVITPTFDSWDNPTGNYNNIMEYAWAPSFTGDMYHEASLRIWAIVTGEYYNCAEYLDLPFAANCAITATQTIQTGPLVTQTNVVTTSYVVSSNLVANYSFENGTLLPTAWSPVRDGSQLDVYPPFWSANLAEARSGFRSVYNGDRFELDQMLMLHAPGDYLAGFYGRCVGDCSGDTATLYWGQSSIAASSGLTNSYQSFSGTHSTGGGSGWLRLVYNDGGSALLVDDVFAYPVDSNGDLVCSQAYYPPPTVDPLNEDCVLDPLTGGCLVVPTGGAGSTCYYCAIPSSASSLEVSYWIAWLGCVLRNLFACSLRIWLLKVGNWTAGVVSLIGAFAVWAPGMVQGGADWLMGSVVASITGAISGITPGGSTNIWDVILALINLMLGIIGVIGGSMIGLVNLIASLITSLRGAFQVAPFTFEFGSGSISAPIPGDLSAAGINDSKILYLLFLGIGFVDGVVVGHPDIETIMQASLGIAGLLLALWTFRYWRRFVSF